MGLIRCYGFLLTSSLDICHVDTQTAFSKPTLLNLGAIYTLVSVCSTSDRESVFSVLTVVLHFPVQAPEFQSSRGCYKETVSAPYVM